MEILAKRLKELRKEKNISLKELSKYLGVSDVAISYWERDLKEPTAPNIREMALFFDVSADYLLGLENDESIKANYYQSFNINSFNNKK